MTIPANLDQAEAYELLEKLNVQAKDTHTRCQAKGKFLGAVPAASGDTLADVCQLVAYVDQGRTLLGEAPLSEQLAKETVRPTAPKVSAKPMTATERTLLAISEANADETAYVAGLLSDQSLNWTQRCQLAREFRDRKRAAATSPTPVPPGRTLNVTERLLAAKGLPLDTKVVTWRR